MAVLIVIGFLVSNHCSLSNKGVTWSYVLAVPSATLMAKFWSFWSLKSNVLLIVPPHCVAIVQCAHDQWLYDEYTCRFIKVVFDPVDVHECAHNFMICFTEKTAAFLWIYIEFSWHLTLVHFEGHIVVKVNTEVLCLTGGLNSRVVKCECCVLWYFIDDLPRSYKYTLSFHGI